MVMARRIDVLGWAVFKSKVCDKLLYHLFWVLNNLSVEVLIGGEFIKVHGCTLTYAPTGRNRLDLAVNECYAWQANKQILRDLCDSQIVEFEQQARTNSKSVMVMASLEENRTANEHPIKKYKEKLQKV